MTNMQIIPAAAVFAVFEGARIWPAIVILHKAASVLGNSLVVVIGGVAGVGEGVWEFHLWFNLSHCCCLAVVVGQSHQ